jgi:two-component SAPR family response regulator
VWAFERLLGALERALAPPQDKTVTIAAQIHKAFALYQGDFLREETHAWALAARERLRGKFLRIVGRAADALHGKQRYREALDCYRKAIEIDPLAERFYQGVMLCSERLGQRAEALDAYRRCRDVLTRELRTTPSEKTETLHRILREQA